MSVEEAPAAVAADEELKRLERATAPQFRAIGIGKKRRGIRLEKVFWDALDGLAARRRQKRNVLIGRLLTGSDENGTSRLRSYALMMIEDERRELADRTAVERSIKMMQQAPVPAFAITRQKRLQQVNGEFMQFLRVASGDITNKVSPELVHLTLDTAIDELFIKLGDHPHAAFCGYTLLIDGKRRQGRVKVVPVPAVQIDVLVGYIVS